jgi:hypothetical protein
LTSFFFFLLLLIRFFLFLFLFLVFFFFFFFFFSLTSATLSFLGTQDLASGLGSGLAVRRQWLTLREESRREPKEYELANSSFQQNVVSFPLTSPRA